MTEPTKNKGFKRLFRALIYSLHGIAACFKTEEAFRQELILSAILVPLGLWIGNGAPEKLLLAGSVLLVLIIELLNSAIERAIDRISFDRHELSKEAKDMGSAALLVSLILCGMIWITILLFPGL